MAEPLGDLTRTHTCGALRAIDVGADVTLLGWAHRIRDLGGVTFIDIRDRAGLSQIVVRDDETLMAAAKRLRSEYVIGIRGVVQRRSEDTVNPKIATGDVEVLAGEIHVLSEAKTPPFQIAEESPVSEDVRLRYRYLDLRRSRLQHNIGLRHRVSMAVRRYLDANGFWEIETPILAKSTPEGARDFLVPSRLHAGEFYALPQSPQIFKQILMIAGTDRYFQIVRCFRDEDQRADRQLRVHADRRRDVVRASRERLRAGRAADAGDLQGDRPRRRGAVPPDGLRRGDCQVRLRQAGSASRHGDPRSVGRFPGLRIPRVQADHRRRRRGARLCRARRKQVFAKSSGRVGRSSQADGVHGTDLGASGIAALELGQVPRARPCWLQRWRVRRPVRTTCC